MPRQVPAKDGGIRPLQVLHAEQHVEQVARQAGGQAEAPTCWPEALERLSLHCTARDGRHPRLRHLQHSAGWARVQGTGSINQQGRAARLPQVTCHACHHGRHPACRPLVSLLHVQAACDAHCSKARSQRPTFCCSSLCQ